jgi:tetratricopeptide (TPR) repeat protein
MRNSLEEIQMRRSYFFITIMAVAVLLLSAMVASAQSGQLRGHVILKKADGTSVGAAGAQIDVFRTDLPGNYPTKADKKGEFVYAGLPFVGTYILAASMPDTNPSIINNVKAGREIDFELVLTPGNGHRYTADEAKAAAKTGPTTGPTGSGGGESASDKANREAAASKNKDIEEKNKKIETANQIVGESFKAGNAALNAKNYDEAVKQYDLGLAADPEQVALLTNKAAALKARGVERYNKAIQSKDTSGTEAAKADFKASADAANTAAELIKKEPAATDPVEQKRQEANKYSAFSVRAEAMRLFVTKDDPTQVDAGEAAYRDYIAVETDPAKKARAELDLAQMMFDANAYDKAKAEYERILTEKPDEPDALANMGLILFNFGAAKEQDGKKDEAKADYQLAANFLQRFVEKAPDGHKFKEDAKAVLAELKNQQNVQAEKNANPTAPAKRKRP